jgi:hypothetical protein
LADRIKALDQWKTPNVSAKSGNDTKLSHAKFSQEPNEVDDYISRLHKTMKSLKSRVEPVKVMDTPDVLKQVGMPDLPIYISRDIVRKATNGVKRNHDLDISVIENLPNLLSDPIAIFKPKDSGIAGKGSKNILVESQTKKGNKVVVTIHGNQQEHRFIVNRIVSAYGKEAHQFQGWINSGLLQYIRSKNPEWLRLQGLQLPKERSFHQGSLSSVITKDDIVKGLNLDSDLSSNEDVKFSRELSPDLAEKLGLNPKKGKVEKAKETAKSILGKSRSDWGNTFNEWMKKANTASLDGLAPIKYAEEQNGITNAEDSGYIASRLASGSSSVMQAVMLHGRPEWKDGIIQKQESSTEKDSMLAIFDDLGKDMHNWLGWMVGNRAKELKAQGRENLLSDQEIDELTGLVQGKEQKFSESKDKFNAMNKALLDLAQDAGLIDPDSRSEWESEWYIPFFRQNEKEDGEGNVIGPWKSKGIANQTPQIQRLKGSEKNINDVLENIFVNTGKLVDASMKNMAMQKVVHNLSDTDIIEVVPRPNKMQFKAKDAVQVSIEGERYLVKVHDPDLYRAMTMIDLERSNHPVMKVAREAKRLLTAGVTASPDFMLRNFLRDSLSSWAISDDGFKPLIDSIRGAKKTLRNEGGTIDMMFSGASFLGGYMNANDPKAMSISVRKALKRKGFNPKQIQQYEASLVTNKKQLIDRIAQGWEQYNRYGEALENSSREAVYEAAIKAGKSKAQAVFEAKDLMDFSMIGGSKIALFLSDVLPFFNARIQGLGKLSRAAKQNPKDIAKRGGMIAGASVALVMMHGDDERYQELPDWDKDMNWHFWFGDQHVRIPKPFEIGVLFGTFPERMVNTMVFEDSGEDLRKAFTRNLVSTFALNPIPQVINPIFEATFNYSAFTGRPIENMYDSSLRPEARYNERTSETMREVGELFGVSPKKLEHVYKGYLGTIGAYILSITDMVTRGVGDHGESPDFKIENLPVVKSFYRGTDRAVSTKYMNDFYDMLGEVDEAYTTINRYRKENRLDEANELYIDNSKKLTQRKFLNQAQKQIRQLNSEIDMITRSRTLTGERKREMIDKKIAQRNAFVAQAVKRINPYFD